ncbi:hypothetical protein [Staphylococcus caprae]|uniref:hypothetical protein n=1 Tax=Staphylococcus caprae TaxID=29380 RepID=UPI001F586FEF|nr:hypothetical protein [Staphylococcus caprae]
MFMYGFNDDEFLKSKSKKSLNYMMIENDNYEDEKTNHVAGFIITSSIICIILFVKWMIG